MTKLKEEKRRGKEKLSYSLDSSTIRHLHVCKEKSNINYCGIWLFQMRHLWQLNHIRSFLHDKIISEVSSNRLLWNLSWIMSVEVLPNSVHLEKSPKQLSRSLLSPPEENLPFPLSFWQPRGEGVTAPSPPFPPLSPFFFLIPFLPLRKSFLPLWRSFLPLWRSYLCPIEPSAHLPPLVARF